MQELDKNENTKESLIKDILEKNENDIKSGKITRVVGESGAEEFRFSAEEKNVGLVFDFDMPAASAETVAEPAESAVDSPVEIAAQHLEAHEQNAPRVEEVTLVSAAEDKVIAVDLPADADEFSIPTSFVVDDKYNTPASEERRAIYSTYVPKFTDASENYRMADQPRPQKPIPRLLSVDPTAEEKQETEGAQIVSIGDAPSSAEAILNVSKPAAAEPAPAKERTVEDERIEIESLLSAKKEEEIAPEEIAADAVSAKEPSAPLSPESYTIPDPEEATLRILDYPEDLGGSALPQEIAKIPVAPVQKKLFAPKEYQNVGQKMAFKDMFLDRLNSVAVRFGAALLLTILLLALENMYLIGLDAVVVLSLQQFPLALPLLDMQIVICLLFLASPELVREIRALTKGLFHSELFLLILFVFQLIYTVATMLSSAEYPQYGFLFGLCVLSVIAGSYLRHRASFLTFRHVGGREEKLAVEKKLTRMLDKEKFALDGAVDEYKSKTARVLRASFITDFFAREHKSAENTRFNLRYLLLSVGVALVASIVMFFIGDGMVSAVSTMMTMLYLSIPLALLLLHRLPFYISVRAASAKGGGVIGETSHFDYAGVDVIAFKDTEVFAKGAVALKHIILYDAAKEFTTVVEQMSSLFSVIGGPLDVLFSETLVKKCPPADEAELEEGGIFGRIADVTFHVGDAAYIASKGIALPREQDNRDPADPATKIMYAAENGRVYAKFYLQYRLSPSYASMLSSFVKEKIVSLVYTRDPNVTNELMRYLAADQDLIRVMREETAGDGDVCERASVGLVASEDKASAISLLLLCRRYVKVQKNLAHALWLVLGAGAFFGAMLSLFGILSIPSVAYGIWHLVLVSAMALYAFEALGENKNSPSGGAEKQ